MDFRITLPLQTAAGNPPRLVDNASLELIGDAAGLQVNVLLDDRMHTRVELAFNEKGQLVLRRWKPDRWSDPEPDDIVVLADLVEEDCGNDAAAVTQN